MIKGLVEEYDKKSIEKMNSSFMVTEYKGHLNTHEENLINLKLREKNILEKLKHPIKVIKRVQELRRVAKIREKLDGLINSSLEEYLGSDSDRFEEDLEDALRYYKPKRIKEFIDSNPIGRAKRLSRNKK